MEGFGDSENEIFSSSKPSQKIVTMFVVMVNLPGTTTGTLVGGLLGLVSYDI